MVAVADQVLTIMPFASVMPDIVARHDIEVKVNSLS
jgi:hypothetical protein